MQRETTGKGWRGDDGEIWYLTSGVGGQEASMGRERLTAKDIEWERQMELEQVSEGIKEREIDRGRWWDHTLHSVIFFCVRVCLCGKKMSVSFTVRRLAEGWGSSSRCVSWLRGLSFVSPSQGRMCTGWCEL